MFSPLTAGQLQPHPRDTIQHCLRRLSRSSPACRLPRRRSARAQYGQLEDAQRLCPLHVQAGRRASTEVFYAGRHGR